MLEQGEVMNLIRQYASNDSIVMFGHSYDSSLNGTFKVTVIATGFSAQKASLYNVRRPLPEMAGASTPRSVRAETVLAGFDEPKSASPEDEMLIPAFLRRRKGRK